MPFHNNNIIIVIVILSFIIATNIITYHRYHCDTEDGEEDVSYFRERANAHPS